MKKILKEYQNTILKLAEHIEKLTLQKESKFYTPQELNNLTARIELLKVERLELMAVCNQIRKHLAPKAKSPSVLGDVS